MSQNDFVIGNQTFPSTRADINSALQALASLSSGGSAPTTTYANMLWYDTTNNILKIRNEADDGWANIAYIDQTSDQFRVLNNTPVVTTANSIQGLLGVQSEATWETATSTTETLVSPAKVKALVDATNLGWTYATAQATTSGTSFDFFGIPSGVNEVTILFNSVSLDGSDDILVQVGQSSGGMLTTGYKSGGQINGATNSTSTSGFTVTGGNASREIIVSMTLHRYGTKWISSHSGIDYTSNRGMFGGGSITTPTGLDRVRITRDGTNTFDGGEVVVGYRA